MLDLKEIRCNHVDQNQLKKRLQHDKMLIRNVSTLFYIGERAYPTHSQTVYFITPIRDAAEKQNLATLLSFNGQEDSKDKIFTLSDVV